MFPSNMFGDFDLKGLIGGDTSIFTTTDVKTILGRNIVKNYLSKIDFEIKTFGYSESSIEIVEFYEDCKTKGGIVEFVSNPVIKMILEEIQNMRTVKFYLKERIFDDIEQEKAQSLDNIFNNNEELSEKINQEKQDFMLQKELKRKEISKIQKKYKCSFEEAEKMYEQFQKQQKMSEVNASLSKEFEKLFSDIDVKPFGFLDIDTSSKSDKSSTNTSEIDLQSDLEEDDSSIDDGFWS